MRRRGVRYVGFLVACVLCACGDSGVSRILDGANNFELKSFSIRYPGLFRKGEKHPNSVEVETIDSVVFKLSPESADSILKGSSISKSRRDAMPLIGDGMGYHAILAFTNSRSQHQIYFYREFAKNGYFRAANHCLYEIALTAEGRNALDRRIGLPDAR